MFPELITNCLLQDLTIEQFQEKTARSLEAVPGVRISKSYASIRRQGEGGVGASVNFPTLLVRDPLELFPIEVNIMMKEAQY